MNKEYFRCVHYEDICIFIKKDTNTIIFRHFNLDTAIQKRNKINISPKINRFYIINIRWFKDYGFNSYLEALDFIKKKIRIPYGCQVDFCGDLT